MNLLLVAELRAHWRLWWAAAAAILAAAIVAALDASLVATAATVGGRRGSDLASANSLIIMFNGVTAIVVVSSVSTLAVALQRRQHALWQLVGVTPRRVSGIVLGQVAVLGMFCAVAGILVSVPLRQPVFDLLVSTMGWVASDAGRRAELPLAATCWTVAIVVVVTIAGALRGARRAANVRAIEALHDDEHRQRRMGWGRWIVVGVCVAAGVPITLSLALDPGDATVSTVPLLGPVLAGLFSALAPILIPVIMRVWTAVIPARWSVSWYLARASAQHRLSMSTSIVTPILTAAALVGGLFTTLQTMSNAMTIRSGHHVAGDADLTTMVLLLGGPVLLAAVGAAATISMSGGQRARDLALLSATGATRGTCVLAALFEGLIYAGTALVGAFLVMLGQGLLSAVLLSGYAPGTTPSFALGPTALVCACGLLLIVPAVTLPVIHRSHRVGRFHL
jgi:putative ABC transport system permease protein